MKRIAPYLLISLLAIPLLSNSQGNIGNLFKSSVELGDQMYEELYYEKAAEFYEQSLKKNQDPATMLKLADTFNQLRNYQKAAEWYQKAFSAGDTIGQAQDILNYANVLLSIEETDQAREWYAKYIVLGEDDLGDRKLKGIDIMDLLKRDSSSVEIHSLPFNSQWSDFGAVSYSDGIVYTSARGLNTFVDPDYLREEDLLDLYHTHSDSLGNWSTPVIFPRKLNTHYHEGPVAFYKSGDKMILTRSNLTDNKAIKSPDGKTKPQLYLSEKNGNDWRIIERLAINNQSFSMAHPSLSTNDDTLFFASDIPGGFGGIDIYMAVRRGDKWGDIQNMGPEINTAGDELYPFIIQNRLFFSSTGHGGLGGLDIFKAYLKNGKVTGVANLGFPYNSPTDDFAFTLDSETMQGYFSSNRPGGKGSDDVYGIDIKFHVLKGKAIQSQDKSPVAEANIKVYQNGELLEEYKTDDEGNFYFYLPFDSDFMVEAEKEGYSFDDGITISTKGNKADLDSLILNMRYQDLFARGIVYDNQTQSGIREALVVLENLSDGKIDSLRTGEDGVYSFPIDPSKKFRISASKYHFYPDTLNFTSFGIEKGELLNDFILDEEYIDKEIIYFDYNSATLKRESYSVLRKVLNLMREYPKDWLIIGAHADARGTEEYNLELSERRAANTRQYFIDNGVDASRIIARGFGEAFIINRCTDGANCQEEDHSKNRRTELTVEIDLPDEERENR